MGQSSSREVLLDNAVGRYHRRSRNLGNSLLFVMPLLVFYQIGVLATGGVRNGVDFATELMWMAAGGQLEIYLCINLGILALFGLAAYILRRRGTFRLRTWPAMVAESTLYALFFGGAVLYIMGFLGVDAALSASAIGADSILAVFVLSLGAGIYEELVFRLILMGGMYWAATRFWDWPPWMAAVVACFISSLAFSAVHHVGPLGDPFSPGIFVFRFVAGVLLALIYYVRGFGVAVYTHAIYDIFVLMS